MPDDAAQHGNVQVAIAVHSDIAKADHLLQAPNQIRIDYTRLCQQSKTVAIGSGNSELPFTDERVGQIDGRLACTQDIQNSRVLPCEVVREPRPGREELLPRATDTALDGRDLRHIHVIHFAYARPVSRTRSKSGAVRSRKCPYSERLLAANSRTFRLSPQ